MVLGQKGVTITQAISFISVCTHVPVIVVSFFVGEHLGWPVEILDNIKLLVKDYSYENLEGVPESYPGDKI